MMNQLRGNGNRFLVKLVLGILIVALVFSGFGSYLIRKKENALASVNGTEISHEEFEEAYQNEYKRLQSQLGNRSFDLAADESYTSLLRQSVMEKLINNILIEQYAKELGLGVSDTQVSEEILATPQFHREGQFDQERYELSLANAGLTANSFANYLRSGLLREQIINALHLSAFTLPKEGETIARLLGQRRTFRKIKISVDRIASSIEVGQKDIKEYYQRHKEELVRPEQIKLSYIELSVDRLTDRVQVSDSDTINYYQEHADQYFTRPQRHLSHILIQSKDRNQAEQLLRKLESGVNFDDLARSNSQDTGSANKGGDIGWIERGTVDSSFEEAAFALKSIGDITGLVKSSFGYHIIKLNGIRSPKPRSFSEVRDSILETLKQERGMEEFLTLKADLEKVTFDSPTSLDPAARMVDTQVLHTDFISLNNLPQALSFETLKSALTSEEVKEKRLNSKILEVRPGELVVVRVDDIRPETIPPLGKVIEDVTQRLIHERALEQARSLAEKLVQSLERGDTSVLSKNALSFSPPISLGRNEELAGPVFKMKKPSEGQKTYTRVMGPEGDIIIIELSEVVDGGVSEPNYLSKIRGQLSLLDGHLSFDTVLKFLRARAEIIYTSVR